jgi:ferric-chelate reductase
MASFLARHLPRHIQDHNEANTTLEYHWAYPERVLPCTKDTGTCEYLAAVYWMHDTSMLYTFILWGVILGILAIWGGLRIARYTEERKRGVTGAIKPFSTSPSLLARLRELRRRFLLVEAPLPVLFGRTSRLQLLLLAVFSIYLTVFTLVGIVYKEWYTPIKGSTLTNYRSGLGGWSDRIGALAYALTPFAVMLGMRESFLSVITGIPHQHFLWMHRWLGRIIFAQSFLHTLGWTLIEARFYKPQPEIFAKFMGQTYAIMGVVAMFLLTLMLVLSTKTSIKWFGYEFFKISHWVIALLFLGACWGHWYQLACWMVPGIALMFVDQGLRLLSMAVLHISPKSRGGGEFPCTTLVLDYFTDDMSPALGFKSADAQITTFNSSSTDIMIRLDFNLHHQQSWSAGQHFYLTFPSLSLIQAHPFTVSSLASSHPNKPHQHMYLIRARAGQTHQLTTLTTPTISTILAGPYGTSFPHQETRHLLAVAGGSGVSFTLPVVQEFLLRSPVHGGGVIDFIWIIRHQHDLLWIADELTFLKAEMIKTLGLRIKIFVTREEEGKSHSHSDEKNPTIFEAAAAAMTLETSSSSSSSTENLANPEKSPSHTTTTTIPPSNPKERLLSSLIPPPSQDSASRFSITYLSHQHPSLPSIVSDFRERCSGNEGVAAEIIGSGPEDMGRDLRRAVAEGEGVGFGERFHWDGRE